MLGLPVLTLVSFYGRELGKWIYMLQGCHITIHFHQTRLIVKVETKLFLCSQCVCVCVCMCVCVCRESRDVCHHPFFTSVLDGSKLLAADINVYSWEWTPYLFNALALELDIYSLAHHLCKMRIFHEPSRVAFCGGINEDSERKSKKIIKYICWLNI